MRKLIGILLSLALVTQARAAVSNPSSYQDYTATGGAAFAFTFPAFATTDVEVFVGGVKQIAGVTVVLNANQATSPGGTATFAVAPANLAAVRIQRTIPLTQGLVLQPYSAFPAKTIEKTFDRLVMQSQQLERTHAADLASTNAALALKRNTSDQAVKDGAQDALIADTRNMASAGIGDAASVLATGSTAAMPLRDWTAQVVNVRAFGAVGDGVTDDTVALQNAASVARAAGRCLVVPGTTWSGVAELRDYYILSAPLDLTGIKCIDFQARIKYTAATGTAITLGTNSFAGYEIKSHFDIRGLALLGTGVGSTATGVLVKNISQSKVEIRSIKGFETGLKLWADSSDYVAHTTFVLQDIRQVKYGIVIDGGPVGGPFNEGGWINENLFLGGNISASDGVAGLIGIWVKASGYDHNNNVWYHPCLQAWATAVQIEGGIANQVIAARDEGSTMIARFTGTANYNYVEVLGNGMASNANKVDDQTGANIVTNERELYTVPLIARSFRDAWDDGTYVHVPGFNVSTSEDGSTWTSSYRANYSHLTLGAAGGITSTWNVRVGITIDTSTTKHFIVTSDRAGGTAPPWLRVVCYDASGNVLAGTSPYYVATQLSVPIMFDAASGTDYARGVNGTTLNGSDDVKNLFFRPEVKSARVEVFGFTNLLGMQVFAVGSMEHSQAGYSIDYVTKGLYPAETWDSPQSDAIPTRFTGWALGTYIRNVSPATLPSVAGWVVSLRKTMTLTAPIAADNHVFVDSTAGISVGDPIQVVAASNGALILSSNVDAVTSATDFWSGHTFTAAAGDLVNVLHWSVVPSMGRTLRAITTQDLASITANTCAADVAMTVTGAATGAECAAGLPTNTSADLQATCHVSAANTVQLRVCNNGASARDPSSGTYSVRVFNP